MNNQIRKKFVVWLRRKHPGTLIKIRDFILYLVSAMGVVPMSATLGVRVLRKDGTVEDKGIVSTHEVTDAFVAYLVDSLQGTEADWINFKYHDSGEDATAEDPSDTALGTPCGEARDTGTQIEGAANIYKSVATHTYAGTFAIVEHGLFNASANGTLMDRSVFSVINVNSGDKVEFTYQLTCNSGG